METARSNERQERKSDGGIGEDRGDQILVGTEGRWRSWGGGEMAHVPGGPDQRE